MSKIIWVCTVTLGKTNLNHKFWIQLSKLIRVMCLNVVPLLDNRILLLVYTSKNARDLLRVKFYLIFFWSFEEFQCLEIIFFLDGTK